MSFTVLLRKKSASVCASAARPARAHSTTSAITRTAANIVASSVRRDRAAASVVARNLGGGDAAIQASAARSRASAFRHAIADTRLGQHDLRIVRPVLDLLP